MFPSPSKIAGLLALTILILSAARFILPCGAYGDAAPAPAPPKVPKEMLEERLEEAKKVWEVYWKLLGHEPDLQPSDILGWSERLLDAELALLDKQEGRVKALRAHVDRTRQVEKLALARQRFRRASPFSVHQASYERINAEIRYSQETGKVLRSSPKNELPEPKEVEPALSLPKSKEKP